jgi:hypothetical protein
MLAQKGFQREYAVRCLDANKHNHATTCYYLLLKRLERDGKIETSKYYQSAQTLYPKSLMASKDSTLPKDGILPRRLADSVENASQNRKRESENNYPMLDSPKREV